MMSFYKRPAPFDRPIFGRFSNFNWIELQIGTGEFQVKNKTGFDTKSAHLHSFYASLVNPLDELFAIATRKGLFLICKFKILLRKSHSVMVIA